MLHPHPVPSPDHSWLDHSEKIFTVVFGVGSALATGWHTIKRWMRHRRRRHELNVARDEAIRVLLDDARQQRHMGAEDVHDATVENTRRGAILDAVRDRFWIASGKLRSAPSGASNPGRGH